MSSKSFVFSCDGWGQQPRTEHIMWAHDTMKAAVKVVKRRSGGIMENIEAPREVQVSADPTRISNIKTVATFWARASVELVEIREDLAEMYRDAGAAGIMEQRALGLGVMIGYLESLMAKEPSTIALHGSLYGRLIEAERRAFEAYRKYRVIKPAGSDLADLA